MEATPSQRVRSTHFPSGPSPHNDGANAHSRGYDIVAAPDMLLVAHG